MNVLVCGARGFVGRAVCAALRRRGHHAVEAASGPPREGVVAIDFARDLEPAAWAPRLRGVDAVVNAVGALRDRPGRPLSAVHDAAPRALFEACARAGLRRVVHVSALGIDGSDTAYARTKRAAEAGLAALSDAGRLDGLVVRPSIVFGRGGASSALFLRLARLPALLLPAPVRSARVQPIAVGELAEVIADSVDPGPDATRLLDAVGPEAVPLGAFIASLRAQAGRAPACVGTLPDALTRASARAGDLVSGSPWCSETLDLLARDNVADPAPFARRLGRTATRFDALLSGALA